MSETRHIQANGSWYEIYEDGTVAECMHTHQAYGPAEERDACHRATEAAIAAAAATLGRRGGRQRTPAQAAARRANGAKGGRPRLYAVTWRLRWGSPIAEDIGLPARGTLARVIAECRRTGASAELRDRTGAAAGRVESDGSYRLA